VDRLDLQVVIVYVGKRDVWEWLHVDTSEGGAVMSRCGYLFGGKNSEHCRNRRDNLLKSIWLQLSLKLQPAI